MTSGLAALVVVVLALPGALMSGMTAKYLVGDFQSLPNALRNPPTPQSSYVYAADGHTLITSFYDQNRRDVPYNEIPQVMREATIAAEDSRFLEHHGVDPTGVVRAMVGNFTSGGVSQGASTLTMQYIRNVLLYTADSVEEQQAATEVTSARKVKEIQYALALEKALDKQEILRRYLNIAYFGHGAYGLYAASQTYFSKLPSDLTLEEAALLIGLVQAPDAYDPTKNTDDAKHRRNWVLKRMADLNYIDRSTADATADKPVKLRPKTTPDDCLSGSEKAGWGFFCGYFKNWWLEQPAFGATPDEREAKLRRGGYTIKTTLDPNTQLAAERNIDAQISKNSPYAMNVTVVEPGTGYVRAMAVNRNYSVDVSRNGPHTANRAMKGSYPNTVNPLVAGGNGVSGYQLGSTFKIFTLLAALEAGKPLSTVFDSPTKFKSIYRISGPPNCDGFYCPSNANPGWMDGRRTMWDAFGRSVNTYFVWLEQQVGAEKVVEMAQRMGIHFRAPSDAILAKPGRAESWGAFTLGVSSATPLDLAAAYATLAAEGTYCAPLPVSSVIAPDGEKLDVAQPSCKRVIDEKVARAATDAARCPVGDSSLSGRCNGGTAPEVRGVVGRAVAGKTGTTEHDSTGSLAIYTPNLAAVGVIVDPDNPNNYVGTANAQRVNAATARTLRDGVAKLPEKKFISPDRSLAYGKDVWAPQPQQPTTSPKSTPAPKPSKSRGSHRN
ncbi:MAG: penicillin-binding protein [Longispora sp.]|nr:penicillin-binding protein [Longispora sp. (in: high G+C Gram-positive bacteria)]